MHGDGKRIYKRLAVSGNRRAKRKRNKHEHNAKNPTEHRRSS